MTFIKKKKNELYVKYKYKNIIFLYKMSSVIFPSSKIWQINIIDTNFANLYSK